MEGALGSVGSKAAGCDVEHLCSELRVQNWSPVRAAGLSSLSVCFGL